MQKLRLAFIGCGGQASKLQANLPQVSSIDFVATCDLVPEKAQGNARRFGALKAYTDFREMIQAERPDAVAVCGAPQMHHEVGIACLGLGCHIFLEKPPAITAAQTKEIVDAAARSGKMGMVATHWRHAPAHRMARQLADQPEFGTVLGFRCKYAAPGPKSGIWGTDSAVRGFLLGQVIHPVDCMRFLVGQEVAEVYAAIAELPDGTTSYAVSFRFDRGAVGTMNLFGGTHTLMMETAIIGASGRCVEVVEAERLTYYKEQPAVGQGGYHDTPSIGWHQGNFYRGYGRPGYVEELEHFATALLASQQPRSSLADAYEDMRILEAIIASNQPRKPVSLSH
ncbi:MAG: Gfo/Idh/MocA family oxidoreductase [Planctomycetes bacterium]|nr:Gfo/Idh/MocA family oxidoreductase [Planctomycetota bacterium]